MTRSTFRLVAPAALALALVGLPLEGQTADEVAIERVVVALAAFSQAGDFAGLDTLYAPGRAVHIIEGAGVNHGWADYRDHHLKPEIAEFENFRYRYFDVEPQVRGDVAWASFRYDLAVDTPRGHVEVDGRSTTILERRDGRWLVVHLHTSGPRKPDGG